MARLRVRFGDMLTLCLAGFCVGIACAMMVPSAPGGRTGGSGGGGFGPALAPGRVRLHLDDEEDDSDDAPAVAESGVAPEGLAPDTRCQAIVWYKKQCKRRKCEGGLCPPHTRKERDSGLRWGRLDQAAAPPPSRGAARGSNDPLPAPEPHSAAEPEHGDVDAEWAALWAGVSEAPNPDSGVFKALHAFVDFTAKFRDQQGAQGLPFYATPLGDIGASEQQFGAFLLHQRTRCSTRRDQRPLVLKQVLEIASAVRSGLAELTFGGVVPTHLVPSAQYSLWLKKRFADWAKEDHASGAREPAQEHVHLSGEQVQAFCLRTLAEYFGGGDASDFSICAALVLRIQSGTNLRAGCLERELRWGDANTTKIDGSYGHIEVLNTKRLTPVGPSAHTLASMRAKVVRHIDDDITGQLFQLWVGRHSSGREKTDYFFPFFTEGQEPQFGRPLTNHQHNAMVRRCAAMLGLAEGERLRLYTTTSLRRGNQAVTEQQVALFRAQRNKDNGWAKTSWVPLQHYTPDSVALAAGPLFWDISGCTEAFEAACSAHLVARFSRRLCTECGFPFDAEQGKCACHACNDIARLRGTGVSTKYAHDKTCWRRGARRHGAFPPEVADRLRKAWADVGCKYSIVWDNGYKFET